MKNRCQFHSVEIAPGKWKHVCRGGIVRESDGPAYNRDCTKSCDQTQPWIPPEVNALVILLPPGKCDLRGEEIRRQVCETCVGRQEIKVFACPIHGECTIGKPLDEIMCCNRCQQRVVAISGEV